MPRGRPKGSKNKPKTTQDEQAIALDTKEIKRQIRALRKCKKDTPKNTEERREINAKIRDLKDQLTKVNPTVCNDPEKQKVIDEILKIRPEYLRTGVNLLKFTIEQLTFHLNKIRR